MSKRLGPRRNISQKEWIAAARKMLVEEGIGAVKVDRLARALGVTRGGFYWRFRNQKHLLDLLLESWRDSNTRAILGVLDTAGTPEVRFQRLIKLWIEEIDFDSKLDTAVRSWGQVFPNVARAVHQADNQRIAALKHLFQDARYSEEEAFVRARITYFHQVGYYALGIHESKLRRKKLSRLYYSVLTGFDQARPES